MKINKVYWVEENIRGVCLLREWCKNDFFPPTLPMKEFAFMMTCTWWGRALKDSPFVPLTLTFVLKSSKVEVLFSRELENFQG